MSRSCDDAFWGRAFEDPRLDAPLKELGVPGHRARITLLVTLIRKHIARPVFEVFPDDSVRGYIAPARKTLWADVDQHSELRRYTQRHRDWAVLLSPICANCCEPHTTHLNDKCLFAATTWREYIPDKPPAEWG